MKDSSNNVFLDFPSLSSLTITSSKNDPGFLKQHPHSYSSTTIVSNNSSGFNIGILKEEKHIKQQQQQIQPKSSKTYYSKKKTDIHAAVKETTAKKRTIIQQFKIFLANNIRPATTTHGQQQQKEQKKHNHHHQKQHRRHYHHPRLLSQYGQVQRKQIGTGASATVRLVQQIQQDGGKMHIYAVKAFRQKKRQTSTKENETKRFMKRLISEFCISSALDHPNIVKTIDLVVDEKNRYCTILEYCPGGDLYTFIKQGQLSLSSQDEINGYFKQLLDGLSYLHRLGVAHRDIKPENLLLVKQKNNSIILKITDFGEADVFREAWQKTSRLSDGLCGSTPYIAPEIFKCSKQGYKASQADVWSAGIVYFCMRFNGVPFYSAQQSDTNYRLYRKHYSECTYPAFQSFDQESKSMIYAMLNPDPEKRYTIQDVLKLTWVADIKPPYYLS